jgi:hypothetical protein
MSCTCVCLATISLAQTEYTAWNYSIIKEFKGYRRQQWRSDVRCHSGPQGEEYEDGCRLRRCAV